ncbi:IS1595 family transposase [Rhizobium sp. NPDC090275]|uniref:IS1595 family transposase n=1 Tax=Rhizobium sp. NPDC090275 TaxID=3364498 RepID=UPI000DDD8050
MASSLFPTRWKYDKPPSIETFVGTFRDDYACAEYLAKKRWPTGFECPRCKSTKAWRLEARPWVWECAGKGNDPLCRHQTSVIAGTVMQGTHLPLRKWFLAAYLVTTHSNGISALQLQPKLGVTYKTAWLVLHKLRKAMVNPDRTPLSGDIDIDESAIPFRRKGDHLKRGGGSSTANQIWIAGAVERIGKYAVGRIRLARIADRTSSSLVPFVVANTLPNSRLRTDKNASYLSVPGRTIDQINLTQAALPAHILFKWIHIVFANVKRWAMGTFHGFREKHLDAYLNEFVFRWNRRRYFRTSMDAMLGIGRSVGPTTWRSIVGDTRQWKQDHIEQIMKMLRPSKRKIVTDLAKYYRVSRVEVMENLAWWVDRLAEEDKSAFLSFKWDIEGVPELSQKLASPRKKPKRPVLVARRPGEERKTSRSYPNPAALNPRIPPVLNAPRPPLAAIAG